jgi:hypothetical protein
MTITARDIIEACAQACDQRAKRSFPWASENSDVYHAQADWAAQCAKDIRALADQYGDAILCEPEPDCWIDPHTGELRKSYWTAPSNDSVPLYRAKEPK